MSDDRPAAERPQICRMRLMLEALQTPRSAQELADMLEFERRTFYRDLNELRALGFVIESERHGRYGARYVLKGWQL